MLAHIKHVSSSARVMRPELTSDTLDPHLAWSAVLVGLATYQARPALVLLVLLLLLDQLFLSRRLLPVFLGLLFGGTVGFRFWLLLCWLFVAPRPLLSRDSLYGDDVKISDFSAFLFLWRFAQDFTGVNSSFTKSWSNA